MMTTRGFVSATRSVATWRRSRATDVTTTSEQASLIYLAPSAPDHVDDGEDDDPDRVDEMPVPGHELHALDVRGLERSRPGEHADEREHHDPDDHVRGVQADQRVERRPEQIRPDRDAFARRIDVFRYVAAQSCFAVVTTRVDRVPRQPRALRKIPKPPERPRSVPSRHAHGQLEHPSRAATSCGQQAMRRRRGYPSCNR